MASVSPQFLKDSAHQVLRLQDIPWQERLTLARQLAEEAQARGNHQAVQFLKDLVRLEHGAKPHFGGAAHHAAARVVEHAAPVVDQPAAVLTPAERIAQAHEAFAVTAPAPDTITAPAPDAVMVSGTEALGITGTAPLIPVEVKPLPPIVTPSSVMANFTEAAKCTVVTDAGASSVACIISNPTMHAGDYITFVAAENAALKTTTPLLTGSIDVPTQSFLHERVVADGVAKVNNLRSTLHPAR